MRVEIWSDVVCPWCYLGKRRLEAALDRFEHATEVEVVWRSFELDPAAPRQRTGSAAEHLAAQVRDDRRAGRRVLGAADRARRGGGARVPPRPHAGGSTLRRPPADPAGRRARHPGRGEGAVPARLLHRRRADRRAATCSTGSQSRRACRPTRWPTCSPATASRRRCARTSERARLLGVAGVPFFAFDQRYGVSGAQSVELLLDALRTAWDSSLERPRRTA